MTSWIVGNWKLNPVSVEAAITLTASLLEPAHELDNCRLVIAPSALHLEAVNQEIKSRASKRAQSNTALERLPIATAAQDVCGQTIDIGAFTGDISAQQLKEVGTSWVIIGHSERRQYYSEDNELLAAKMIHSLHSGLGVILCIGESEDQYIANETQAILTHQLSVISDILNNASAIEVSQLSNNLIVAYEPVWAIGTGKIPSVDEVTSVHLRIREYLVGLEAYLIDVPILYGGSVKPDNAVQFASSQAIDGVLVGGAALSADSFISIAQAFDKCQ